MIIYCIYFVIVILLKRAQIRHSCLKCCLRSISNAVCPGENVQFTVNLHNLASIGYISVLVLRPAVYQTLELDQKFWQNFCTRCRKKESTAGWHNVSFCLQYIRPALHICLLQYICRNIHIYVSHRLEAWLNEQGIKHAPMVHDVQRLF